MTLNSDVIELRGSLLHNHSTTNLNSLGLRWPGECPACDRAREGWNK